MVIAAKGLDKKIVGLESIKFINYSSSWGRVTCIIEADIGRKYQSWVGDTREEVTVKLLLTALREAIKVREQLNGKQKSHR